MYIARVNEVTRIFYDGASCHSFATTEIVNKRGAKRTSTTPPAISAFSRNEAILNDEVTVVQIVAIDGDVSCWLRVRVINCFRSTCCLAIPKVEIYEPTKGGIDLPDDTTKSWIKLG